MSEDFEERLAAVDEALAGESVSSGRVGSGSGGRDGGEGSGSGGRGGGVGSGAGGRGGGEASSPEALTDSGGVRDDEVPGGVAVDVCALEDRVAELEAAVEALRGYAGSVRAVNDRVEERADAAVATVESLQDRVDDVERRVDEDARSSGGGGGSPRRGRPFDGACDDGGGSRGGPRAGGRAGERSQGRDLDGDVTGSTVSRSASVRARDGEGRGTGSTGAESRGRRVASSGGPREPYGSVSDAEASEEAGLFARLRDAL